MLRFSPILLFTALLFLFGCGGGTGGADAGPPPGWEVADGRWWLPGTDTTAAFRDMESLESMGVAGSRTFAADVASARRERGPVVEGVKRALIRMYRNEPEVVDSLFQRIVLPQIEEAQLTGNMSDDIDRLRREGYRAMGRSFQEPRTALALGDDVPVVYPDSLRRQNVGGSVRMQVYLNEEGAPEAVRLLEGVHPALDDIAMRATTQMRWRPAYLLRGNRWVAIPSWARFNISFTPES